jgi:hypothetical protein
VFSNNSIYYHEMMTWGRTWKGQFVSAPVNIRWAAQRLGLENLMDGEGLVSHIVRQLVVGTLAWAGGQNTHYRFLYCLRTWWLDSKGKQRESQRDSQR